MLRTISLAVLAAGVAAPAYAGALTEPVDAEVYASGFVRPLEFVQSTADDGVQYIVQQGGTIRVIQDGAVVPGNFLSVQSLITTSGNEQGLLGMALDPDHANNGRFYINYTRSGGDTVVARYTLDTTARGGFDLLSADASSAEILIVEDQDFSNHNGGNLRLGPDGMLYIAFGDGGSGGDPFGRAQNRTRLLGSIARIDVSTATGYDIPSDNPYAGSSSFREEIWAYGVRNPWKFTFDTGPCSTGSILIADVGQGPTNGREEINVQPGDAAGLNYGWDCREGLVEFGGCAPPTGESFTDPAFEYTHASGFGRSITGGFVYRGAEMIHNRGRYFFADFITGRVSSLEVNFGDGTMTDYIEHTTDLGGVGNVSAFGQDADGELYILSFNGNIYRVRGTITAGDANRDGVVDSADLGVLLAAWGDDGCGEADINNDENVDSSDLGTLLANWGVTTN